MEEELLKEKTIFYDDISEISNIIKSNLEKHFVLVSHNSSDKKIVFKQLSHRSKNNDYCNPKCLFP
jgi:hypothetical protein